MPTASVVRRKATPAAVDKSLSASNTKIQTLPEGTPPVDRSYQHVAFSVSEGDLIAYRERLERIGAEVLPPRPRVSGEGLSLYVYDFDNHLFELHTGTLDQRLARYAAEL